MKTCPSVGAVPRTWSLSLSPEAADVSAPELSAESAELFERLERVLGDAIVEHAVMYGDAVVRVKPDAWQRAARACKTEGECDYLCFVAGIDWMPTPSVVEEGSGDTSAPVQPKEQT